MRVNARFEGEAEQQLTYLAEATGLGVSEVLRASVQHYYDQVRARQGGLTHFAAYVGKGRSGRADVAGSYKARLAEGWGGKHQGRGLSVHEPATSFGNVQPPRPPKSAKPGKPSESGA